MNTKMLKKAALCVALGACLGALAPTVMAQSATGAIAGRANAGDQITITNTATGLTRTVTASRDGNYRLGQLPVGDYRLQLQRDGRSEGEPLSVNVALGGTTTVNLGGGGEAITLDSIQVVGSRIVNRVDVYSTETVTTVSREELARMPVAQDMGSVALLAPGVVGGNSSFGGISFGGSSVAENSVFINGLNVTDFYRRQSFSSAPFAFFQEFQVKTGGYSVEFGRTTGGVINAVTRSGTNEFEYGTEISWEPSFLQATKTNHYDSAGAPYIIGSYDEYDRTNASVYASGPIVRDKLFFFALYEARDYKPVNTNNFGDAFFDASEDNGFWGAKLDWQINDRHLVELLAFSDKSETVTDNYKFDLPSGTRLGFENTQFVDNGGTNWAATYSGYLTDTLSVKALYGENEREFSRTSMNDIECSRMRDRRPGQGNRDTGCTQSPNITQRTDTREAMRLDFEWALADHLLRFGLDRENNTSQHEQYYAGPDRLLWEVYRTDVPRLENGFAVPIGTDYVRTRSNEVDGEFETINSAYYLEDNWSVTPSLVLNAGVRLEAFDNRDSDGRSYIKIDDMVAPRFGFSWDIKGDNRSKLFGNAGRYFLPVANVINIKQAGGFLDARTYYAFEGFETFEHNGQTYQRPILGPQLGPVDNSQGDGTVGDLRGQVDADMDPVYQDELILGFQSMIDDKWSWGVRGIYRKLHNAIDDMEVTSNGIVCDGEPGYVGFVMANPSRPLTVYTDTNCDGEDDGFVTIDTRRAGWAMYDADGNYVSEVGWSEPKRTYKAIELMIDRAWDGRWALNATYTLSWNKGNAEGPVNSDTDFADAGRTEAFDNPWVNYGAYGYLPNDRRHQFKVRGSYALGDHWEFGASLNVQSGRPISAMGGANPFDDTVFDYNSFFIFNETTGQYELHPRGSQGHTPWLYDLGANVTYRYSFSMADLSVKLAVYNLLNQQRITQVDERLGSIPDGNVDYRLGTGYTAPRYGMLTLKLDF